MDEADVRIVCRRPRSAEEPDRSDSCHRARCQSGEVLMLAWMNQESLALTIATGQATY